ncbi:MAG: DUF5993 family protein [Burkholderiaceae bacterium]|nr:DUF5993 family protein [Burkholderiaceae bacterium]
MEILPSILFAVIAIWMASSGRRSIAIVSWVLALLCMLGVMAFHMDSALNISL